jgi:release factor glutamine methyltransferase
MRLVTPPGVFRPISDSRMLSACLAGEVRPGARVADVCTGSGVLAVVAALGGAVATAVDVSRRAVATTRLNARLNGVSVRALRGDLLHPLAGERFDVIVSNPPYVPAATDASIGSARAWAGGPDGRALLDRLCREAPRHLRPGGALLLVQSSVCGERETVERLAAQGLGAAVIARRRGPLGPLMREHLDPALREEELLVVRGRLPFR